MLKIANLFARYSCPMWCDVWVIRGFCRKAYRWLAENPKLYRRAMLRRGINPQWLNHPAQLPLEVDTYPPLYADLRFAPWEEVADPEDPKQYNLISSTGRQVIRWSTDYCSWKIFELTGERPERNLSGRFDAHDWVEFLSQAGYQTVVDHPEPGHHYVGVIPCQGEFGQVVWFGKADGTGYWCSTYEHFHFQTLCIKRDFRKIIWVQID